jgi:hypothetical protein
LALQIRNLLVSLGDYLLRLGDLSPKLFVLFLELLVLSPQFLLVEWALMGTQPWPLKLKRPSSTSRILERPRTHPPYDTRSRAKCPAFSYSRRSGG